MDIVLEEGKCQSDDIDKWIEEWKEKQNTVIRDKHENELWQDELSALADASVPSDREETDQVEQLQVNADPDWREKKVFADYAEQASWKATEKSDESRLRQESLLEKRQQLQRHQQTVSREHDVEYRVEEPTHRGELERRNQERTKPCPQCAEVINYESRLCRFCGTEFGLGPPGDITHRTQNNPSSPSSRYGTLQKAALACWGSGGILVVVSTLAVLFGKHPASGVGRGITYPASGDLGRGINYIIALVLDWIERSPVTSGALMIGIILLVVGSLLHKAGTGIDRN